jgi:hypothetical protein
MASPAPELHAESGVACVTREEQSKHVADTAQRLGVVDELRRVQAATERLFPGMVNIEVMQDPEINDLVFLVFNVVGRGADAEVMARMDQWYSESTRIAGKNASFFTISVDVD